MIAALPIIPISLPTPFIVGPVNAFLIHRDPITLVDTGVATTESYDALVAGLQAQGLCISDLEAILVTHGHIDHIGQLARLVGESGAKTFGHVSVVPKGDPHESERISREFVLGVFRQSGVPEGVIAETRKAREKSIGLGEPPRIDHPLNDGDRIFEFDVLHAPGHSSSDTLFVHRELALAFTGDHVLKGVNPTPLIRRDPATGGRVKSLLEFERSLERTRSLDLKTMYPGHGSVIASPAGAIERILQRQERRTEKVLGVVREKAVTPYEVSRVLFPDLKAEHTYLALSTALGHLDILEARHQVHVDARGGILYYASLRRD